MNEQERTGVNNGKIVNIRKYIEMQYPLACGDILFREWLIDTSNAIAEQNSKLKIAVEALKYVCRTTMSSLDVGDHKVCKNALTAIDTILKETK